VPSRLCPAARRRRSRSQTLHAVGFSATEVCGLPTCGCNPQELRSRRPPRIRDGEVADICRSNFLRKAAQCNHFVCSHTVMCNYLKLSAQLKETETKFVLFQPTADEIVLFRFCLSCAHSFIIVSVLRQRSTTYTDAKKLYKAAEYSIDYSIPLHLP